jgi:glyoxylase-like metal-dependent hydrolase (beta-lactamase superfamily II)
MGNQLSIGIFVGSENALYVTSTLVSGEHSAVLIDAQFIRSDARRLADWVRASGKNLTTVYVTHGHPDHYWGFTTLSESFPTARFVAAPEVVAVIEETYAAKLAQWKPRLGDEAPDAPRKPEVFRGDVISLEGNEIQIIHIGQGDVRSSTVVWIPSLSTLVAGDLAYDGTHVWLAEADALQRREWMANLDHLAGMAPRTVVAGHKVPGSDTEGRRVLIDQTRDYIAAYDGAVAQSSSAEELIAKMTALYPDRALPIMLEISAHAAFPGEARKAA